MIKLTAPKLNKLLKGMGNSTRLSSTEWNFSSIAGNLYIHFIDNDFVHMKFDDPKRASDTLSNNFKLRLNPFSGKFNFHWDKKTSYDYKIAELCSYLTNLITQGN